MASTHSVLFLNKCDINHHAISIYLKYIVVQMRAGLSLSHSLLAKDLQATCVFWKAPGGPWSPAGGGHYWEWTQAQTAVSSTFLSLVLIISAVAQSCLPLQPRGLQHSRLPCPSPTPGASSNSCPLVMPSNHLILYRPLLLLPSVFPSISLFWWVSHVLSIGTDWHKLCHQWMLLNKSLWITWYCVSFLAVSLSLCTVLLILVYAAFCAYSTRAPAVCWVLHWMW